MKISKSKIQFFASLKQKKVRRETGLFTAEGSKCVLDTLDAFVPELIVATEKWLETYKENISASRIEDDKLYTASPAEMERMSQMSTPPQVIAVYHTPQTCREEWLSGVGNRLTLLLDGVQDPGNLGTIIRSADWFGIHHIAASESTADLYNLKTVQATMGAVSRVRMLYCDLPELVESAEGLPVYGTLLDGETIYEAELSPTGFIVMGNEGKGLTERMRRLVTKRLRIPSYPPGVSGSESLNVAAATAITLAEFRRRDCGMGS